MSSERQLELLTRVSEYFSGDERASWVNKFGRNADIDGPVETICRQGGTWVGAGVNYDEDPQTLVVASTSIDDAVGQLAAQAVCIEGLKTWLDVEYSSEDVDLNGTSEVTLANQYVMINRAYVIGSGTQQAALNSGTVSIGPAGLATVWAQIAPDVGQTEQAALAIPADTDAYIDKYYCNALRSTSSAYNVFLKVSDESGINHSCFLTKHVLSNQGLTEHEFHPPAKFSGPCVICLDAETSQTNVDVSGGFDVILRRRLGGA